MLTDRSPLTKDVTFAVVATHTWRLADLGSKHMLLRGGVGWGNMPEHMVREDLARGRLVRIQLEPRNHGVEHVAVGIVGAAAVPLADVQHPVRPEHEMPAVVIGERLPQPEQFTAKQTQANNLFAPFRTTKATGMGLGLSICRSIIEAHGGRIWSVPDGADHGADIRFTLPSYTELKSES